MLRVITLLLVPVAAYLGFRCLPQFSGDAIIHLAIMERSARGEWFCFNPGLPEASSSSPLWTVLGAGLMRLGGLPFALVALKAAAYAAWLSIGALVYRGALVLGARPPHATLGAVLSVAMPGTALNCLQGMENGPFAALVLGALYVHRGAATRSRSALAFGLVGLACALRAEGVIALVVLAALPAALSRRNAPVAAAAFLCGWAPCAALYAIKTGHVIPVSGIGRVMAARRDVLSVHAGPLWLYGTPVVRLIAYLPLTVACWVGLRRAKAYAWTAAGGVLVYAVGVGAAQTSRYMIWVFASLCVLLAVAFDDSQFAKKGVLAVGWLAVAVAGELWLRGPPSGVELGDLIRAPSRRQADTDALLQLACSGGCCAGRPEVAAVEVQERFRFDDRVRVVSLDGITGGPAGNALRFARDGCPLLGDLEADPDLVLLQDDPRDVFPRCPFEGPEASFADLMVDPAPKAGWLRSGGVAIRACLPPRRAP